MKLSTHTKIADVGEVAAAIVRQFEMETALEKDAFLSPLMARIKKDGEDLTTAYKKDRFSSELDDLDRKRDNLVRNLGTAIEGYSVLPLEEYSTSAKALKAVFDKYGRAIIDENYSAESTNIKSLIGDFSLEESKAAIKALPGVSEILNMLVEAQGAFDKASDEFTRATKSKGESATAIKKRVLSEINSELLPFLKAVRKSEIYSSFINVVNGEIEKVNATAQTKKAKVAK